MTALTRAATAADLSWIAPAAIASHVVDTPAGLEAVLAAEPWRLRVTEAGDAALLERWRPALDDLAIAGLWCPQRRIPVLVADLARVTASHGFARLIAPIVHEDVAGPYLAAGMTVLERIAVMRLEGRALARAGARAKAPAAETEVREAAAADVAAISELDAVCFPPFWHYDPATLGRLAAGGRLAVAVRGGAHVGYTLSTLHGPQGSLGRIAVAPHVQRHGIGRALAADSVAWMTSHGARTVVLSTQDGNAAAKALYGGLGFVIAPGSLVVLATGLLRRGEECV